MIHTPYPEEVRRQYAVSSTTCTFRIVPECDRIATAVDSKIFLWTRGDLTTLGLSHPVIFMTSMPANSAFSEFVSSILIVATTRTVDLLPIEVSNGKARIYESDISTTLTATHIVTTRSGRVFCACADGSIAELKYSKEDTWTGTKLQTFRHDTSFLTRAFNFMRILRSNPVEGMCVDESANLLYVVRGAQIDSYRMEDFMKETVAKNTRNKAASVDKKGSSGSAQDSLAWDTPVSVCAASNTVYLSTTTQLIKCVVETGSLRPISTESKESKCFNTMVYERNNTELVITDVYTATKLVVPWSYGEVLDVNALNSGQLHSNTRFEKSRIYVLLTDNGSVQVEHVLPYGKLCEHAENGEQSRIFGLIAQRGLREILSLSVYGFLSTHSQKLKGNLSRLLSKYRDGVDEALKDVFSELGKKLFRDGSPNQPLLERFCVLFSRENLYKIGANTEFNVVLQALRCNPGSQRLRNAFSLLGTISFSEFITRIQGVVDEEGLSLCTKRVLDSIKACCSNCTLSSNSVNEALRTLVRPEDIHALISLLAAHHYHIEALDVLSKTWKSLDTTTLGPLVATINVTIRQALELQDPYLARIFISHLIRSKPSECVSEGNVFEEFLEESPYSEHQIFLASCYCNKGKWSRACSKYMELAESRAYSFTLDERIVFLVKARLCARAAGDYAADRIEELLQLSRHQKKIMERVGCTKDLESLKSADVLFNEYVVPLGLYDIGLDLMDFCGNGDRRALNLLWTNHLRSVSKEKIFEDVCDRKRRYSTKVFAMEIVKPLLMLYAESEDARLAYEEALM